MKEPYSKFRKAWDNLNSRPIDINDLPRSRNGKDCSCTCVECKDALVACQGYIKAWYFRHQSNATCKGGPMTALHLMAQYLLVGDHVIKTIVGDVSYSNGIMESVIPGSRFEADISGIKENGDQFIVEIYVSHELETAKVEFLKGQRIHSIRN